MRKYSWLKGSTNTINSIVFLFFLQLYLILSILVESQWDSQQDAIETVVCASGMSARPRLHSWWDRHEVIHQGGNMCRDKYLHEGSHVCVLADDVRKQNKNDRTFCRRWSSNFDGKCSLTLSPKCKGTMASRSGKVPIVNKLWAPKNVHFGKIHF